MAEPNKSFTESCSTEQQNVGVLSGGRCGDNGRCLGLCFFVQDMRFWNLFACNGSDSIEREILKMKNLETPVLETKGD